MKKQSFLLLAYALFFSFTACSGASDKGKSQNTTIAETTTDEDETLSDEELAQNAYDLIDAIEQTCKTGIYCIQDVWYSGIYDVDSCTEDNVKEKLATLIGVDVSVIDEYGGGFTTEQLLYGDDNYSAWQYWVWTVENCYTAAEIYTDLDKSLELAKETINKISPQYTNYENLKKYYIKVASYVNFFEDMHCSLTELDGSISQYESDIKDAKEPLLFDFG